MMILRQTIILNDYYPISLLGNPSFLFYLYKLIIHDPNIVISPLLLSFDLFESFGNYINTGRLNLKKTRMRELFFKKKRLSTAKIIYSEKMHTTIFLKTLLEGIYQILTIIYESNFSENSHGFRKNKSAHSALLTIDRTFTCADWFISGEFINNNNHKATTNLKIGNKLLGIIIKNNLTALDPLFLDLIAKIIRTTILNLSQIPNSFDGLHRFEQKKLVGLFWNIYLTIFDNYLFSLDNYYYLTLQQSIFWNFNQKHKIVNLFNKLNNQIMINRQITIENTNNQQDFFCKNMIQKTNYSLISQNTTTFLNNTYSINNKPEIDSTTIPFLNLQFNKIQSNNSDINKFSFQKLQNKMQPIQPVPNCFTNSYNNIFKYIRYCNSFIFGFIGSKKAAIAFSFIIERLIDLILSLTIQSTHLKITDLRVSSALNNNKKKSNYRLNNNYIIFLWTKISRNNNFVPSPLIVQNSLKKNKKIISSHYSQLSNKDNSVAYNYQKLINHKYYTNYFAKKLINNFTNIPVVPTITTVNTFNTTTILSQQSHRLIFLKEKLDQFSNNDLSLTAPFSIIKTALEKAGYLKLGRPTRAGWLIHFDEIKIVKTYLKVVSQILTYYFFVKNFKQLKKKIFYLLRYSCALTLAAKLKLRSKHKVFRKFGKNLTIKKTGKEIITFSEP